MTRESPSPAAPLQLPRRRLLQALGLPLLGPLVLAACGSAPPAPRLLRWPTRPVSGLPEVPDAQPGTWQLMPWGALPDWMDRHDVLVADGPAGLRALPGVRWIEPLRDALPRLLALDLTALRAPHALWIGTVPPGVRVDRQLRVQVLALDSLAQPAQVRLQAKWSLADPAGKQPPQLVDEHIEQAWDGSVDGLVLAQRLAMWTLARRITAAPRETQAL